MKCPVCGKEHEPVKINVFQLEKCMNATLEWAKKVLEGKMSLVDALNEAASTKPESQVQIVIAPRGWIFVGYCHKDESDLVISRAHTVRKWGTTKGIGELSKGPTKDTVLDHAGVVRIPLSAVLAKIDCEEEAWSTKI